MSGAGIAIVGAGHAGTQLCASLREQGFDGAVTLVSAEPDLPYHRPPLSKSFMSSPDAALQHLRAESFFDDKRIDILLGEPVAAIDRPGRRLDLASGRALAFDTLVLATGTSARRLDLPGADLEGVVYLRTAGDARRMRSLLEDIGSAVVIGGGFIGLEAAAMLRRRGIGVTVLEVAPRLLGRAATAEMAAQIREGLERLGTRVICDARIERIEGREGRSGRVAAVRTADGTAHAADLVVAGIGAAPITTLAEAADLATGNGVAVDAWLRTSVPGVFALGDCVSFPQAQTGQRMRLESVQNATDQARALARTLTGRQSAYDAVPWFWSDIGDMKLQIAGLSAGADEQVSRWEGDGLQAVFHLTRGALAAVETLNQPGLHMLARRLIAAGITPPREVLRTGDMDALKALARSSKR